MRVLAVTSPWPRQVDEADQDSVARQLARLRQAGIEVEELAMPRPGGPGVVGTLLRLRRMLAQGGFDLAHALHGPAGAVLTPQSRVPFVVTVREGDVPAALPRGARVRTWLARRLTRYAVQRADEVAVVSTSLIRRLPARTYHVMPSGVDLEKFMPMAQGQARQHLGLGSGTRLILTAGDGPATQLVAGSEALMQVRQRLPTDLLDLATVPADKMMLYLNAADVLLCTASAPRASALITGALACNLPVVAAGGTAGVEALDASPGYTVCQDDLPQTLGAALVGWLEGSARPQSRANVMRYDDRHLAGDLIGIYQRARAARGSRV